MNDVVWAPRAARYAEELAGAGMIRDPSWRAVFETTARHPFVPRFWELDTYNSPHRLVDGDDPAQREVWLDAVYSDRFLVTQWVPSVTATGRPIRVVTSSASQPCTVAVMLDRLDVRDGLRVLEIGTGTGYNAALLSTRLGPGRVHSVDIDAGLVHAADAALRAGNHRVALRVADGGHGWPGGGPFDRILATCSVDRIPPAWVDQLVPGGRLVAPLSFGAALAVLDKTDDQHLIGRIDPFAVSFMPLRTAPDQAMPPHCAPGLPDPATLGVAASGTTDVDPRSLQQPDFPLWLSLFLPGVLVTDHWRAGHREATTIYTARQRATAAHTPIGDAEWPVVQHGGRPWDVLERAWHAWERHGRPARSRLGLTVNRDGEQRVLVDGAPIEGSSR